MLGWSSWTSWAQPDGKPDRLGFFVGDAAGCHRCSGETKHYGLCGRVGVWGGGWVGYGERWMVKVGVKAFQSWIWVDRALKSFFYFFSSHVCGGRVKQRGFCQGFIDVLRWSGAGENSDSACSFWVMIIISCLRIYCGFIKCITQ